MNCLFHQVSPEELVKQAEEKERETDGVMKQTKVLGLPYIQTILSTVLKLLI